MSGVMLQETKETFWWLEKKSKLLSEAAERGSGDGGSRTGRQELLAAWPRELPSLAASPSLCSANFSQGNLLFISCSNCSKSGRNRPQTIYSDFWWGALISAEPEQDQDLLLVLGMQRNVSAALGWRGNQGALGWCSPQSLAVPGAGTEAAVWLMWMSLPGCPDPFSPPWRPAGTWTWAMRGGEMSRGHSWCHPKDRGMLWGKQADEKCHGGLRAFPTPRCESERG